MVFLNGRAIPEPEHRGQPIIDDSFLFNAAEEEISLYVPQ